MKKAGSRYKVECSSCKELQGTCFAYCVKCGNKLPQIQRELKLNLNE